MSGTIDQLSLAQLFSEARTHNVFLDKPIGDATLKQIYDIMKWGPTSANCSPARILFLRTKEAKERRAELDPDEANHDTTAWFER